MAAHLHVVHLAAALSVSSSYSSSTRGPRAADAEADPARRFFLAGRRRALGRAP
eukprot:CAMPEP_0115502848 /NCGR_PEP_ID=MMETSP0271-20121206/69163_1 /TAXON_ID=71861 /ORGANISM="Scrippsiella trochoidea, Strain CCMP3099" /LENGTH=53 /DNA_ID=CAMNT_0002931903 /DNA_START=85 /DNA_END=243 /DNA_ORIENTATION=+